MAVITELIEIGRQLKRAGKLQGAIEHFLQLHRTYPDNARISFELAGAWRAFGVPEQALPLYQALLKLPSGQGLPPKDMPRLYTHLGAALLETRAVDRALTVLEAGLQAHPSYRPLRAWRIIALARADATQEALLQALELMLESLAPSRWDIFEEEIAAIVREMRAEAWDAPAVPDVEPPIAPEAEAPAAAPAPAMPPQASTIAIAEPEAPAAEREIEVRVKAPPPKSKRKAGKTQLGKKAVRINIAGAGDKPGSATANEDEPPAAASSFKIPVDDD